MSDRTYAAAKRKVLARHPRAIEFHHRYADKGWNIYVPPLTLLGYGDTRAEAWRNAARGMK